MKKDWLDKGIKHKLSGHASPLDIEGAWNELESLRKKRKDRKYFIPFIFFTLLAFASMYVKNTSSTIINDAENISNIHMDVANYEVKQTLSTNTINNNSTITNNNDNTSNDISIISEPVTPDITEITKINSSESNKNKSETRINSTSFAVDTKRNSEEIIVTEAPSLIENDKITNIFTDEENDKFSSIVVDGKNAIESKGVHGNEVIEEFDAFGIINPIFSNNPFLDYEFEPGIDDELSELGEELNRSYNHMNFRPDSWIKITTTIGKPALDISPRTDEEVGHYRANEDILEDLGLEVSYRKYFGNHFFTEGGIRLSQLSSRRQESYVSNYTQTKDDEVVAIIINSDGSQTEILGEVDQSITETSRSTTYNTHRNVAATLLAGYEFGSSSRLSLGLSAGLMYNLISKKKGTSFTPISPEEYWDLNTLPYRERGPLTFLFRPEMNYLIHKTLSVSAGFQFSTDIGSWTTSEAIFSQKYAGLAGHIGLRIGL